MPSIFDEDKPPYEETYKQWKANPTPQQRSLLLKQVKPVLDTAVFSYAGKGASPAVRSQAKLMALKAFDTYDPNRGNLKTHLLSQLRGLQRISAQQQQPVRIPERLSLMRQKLQDATNTLQDDLGRPPSDLELADYMGVSPAKLQRARAANPGVNTGIFTDEEGNPYLPESTTPHDTRTTDAWAEMVYYDLSDIDRVILDHSLGMHGAPILENRKIASLLGISPGAVSQRKSRIQAMLNEQLELSPFGAN